MKTKTFMMSLRASALEGFSEFFGLLYEGAVKTMGALLLLTLVMGDVPWQ